MSEPTEPPGLPSISGAPISVLLLAHNEQAHLGDVIESWLKQLGRLQRDHQLIVVDDGSTDRTAAIAQEQARQHPAMVYLRHPSLQGSGAALKTGLAAARYPLLLYTTCDRQYLSVDLQQLLTEIDKAHLVCGYRRRQPVPRWLQTMGRIWRGLAWMSMSVALEPLPGWLGWKSHLHALFMRVFFGLRLRDCGCRFRLFRRALFERVPVQSQGEFAHDEVLAKANFLGAMMTDVPIQHQPRKESRAEPLGQWWRDFHRVLSYPTFGPTHLGKGSQFATLQP